MFFESVNDVVEECAEERESLANACSWYASCIDAAFDEFRFLRVPLRFRMEPRLVNDLFFTGGK